LNDYGFCIPPIVTDALSTVIGADKKQFKIFKIWPAKLSVQVDIENDPAVSAIDPTTGMTDVGNYISIRPFCVMLSISVKSNL
jgi:hypothetical protein